MDILRGKTPEMVRKEVWMHLLAYNLIRTVMAQGATQAGPLADRPDHAASASIPARAAPGGRTPGRGAA